MDGGVGNTNGSLHNLTAQQQAFYGIGPAYDQPDADPQSFSVPGADRQPDADLQSFSMLGAASLPSSHVENLCSSHAANLPSSHAASPSYGCGADLRPSKPAKRKRSAVAPEKRSVDLSEDCMRQMILSKGKILCNVPALTERLTECCAENAPIAFSGSPARERWRIPDEQDRRYNIMVSKGHGKALGGNDDEYDGHGYQCCVVCHAPPDAGRQVFFGGKVAGSPRAALENLFIAVAEYVEIVKRVMVRNAKIWALPSGGRIAIGMDRNEDE